MTLHTKLIAQSDAASINLNNYQFTIQWLQNQPFKLIKATIEQLEDILHDTIIAAELVQVSTATDQELTKLIEEVQNAYYLARRVHGDTMKVREGSGIPYIHHPLTVTIFAWYLARLLQFKNIEPRMLLLGAIYHDTIEDTMIHGTADTGMQFSEMGHLHGEKLLTILQYVTKPPLNIDKKFHKAREHYKILHLADFKHRVVPIEARLIKVADKIMNLSDLEYMPQSERVKQITFTERYFHPVLYFLPLEIKALFYNHMITIKSKYAGQINWEATVK